MTVKDRVRELVALEKSSAAFCRKVGMSPTSLSTMLRRDKGSLNYDTVLKILSAYPEIDPMWFLLGEGEMYLSKEASKELHSQGEDELAEKVIEMMEDKLGEHLIAYRDLSETLKKRVTMLEKIIQKNLPNIAADLGIE